MQNKNKQQLKKLKDMTQVFNITNSKEGQYTYGRHYRGYGVWQTIVENGRKSGKFVKDFFSKEEARDFVYLMNGWTKVA